MRELPRQPIPYGHDIDGTLKIKKIFSPTVGN